MKLIIEKEKIIDISEKYLRKLICSLKATKTHFIDTQKKELLAQMAYTLKAGKIDDDIVDIGEEPTLEQYITAMNLYNAYDNCDSSAFLTKMIPGSTIVSAISTLDFYFSQILHTMLDFDPNLAGSIEIKLPYKDIRDLEESADIREYCVSTYIEGLFFGSHDDLFGTMAKNFNLKSIKQIEGYKDFLFVTELRNIIVHHDAKISLKFKLNMDKYKIKYEKYHFFDKNGYISLNPNNVLWIIDV